jgi:hypothetical protein
MTDQLLSTDYNTTYFERLIVGDFVVSGLVFGQIDAINFGVAEIATRPNSYVIISPTRYWHKLNPSEIVKMRLNE